jgi:hypothetical protein
MGTGNSGAWTFQAYILPFPYRAAPKVVKRTPPLDVANTNGTFIAFNPLGRNVRAKKSLMCIVRNPSAPSGGVPTLEVIFQHSCDNGQTWSDIAHTVTIPNQDFCCFISVIAAGSTSVSPISDGTSLYSTVVQGPIGDKIRVKYKVAPGTRGSYAFQALAFVD